jgi:serine/threonine-protein kinase RsbT
MDTETRVPILRDVDVVTARQSGRALGASLGFGAADLTLIATAISELARNIVDYAGRGEIVLAIAEERGRRVLVVVARDDGPGIPDVGLALQDGWSSGRGLGLGLPGARRMVDEFEIDTAPGRGTTVTLKKWLPEGR